MDLTIADHLLVSLLFIVMPVLSVTDWRKLESRLDAGRPNARLLFYRSIMAWSWGLTLVVAALWLVYTRGIPQLGFGFETGRGFWIGLAITGVGCALIVVQMIGLRHDPEKLKAAAAQFRPLRAMLPRTDREANEFAALSITAGICEEIIFRGYMMVYLASAIPAGGLWLAALGSSLVFGLQHTYQGPMGVLRSGLVGLALAGLYLLTGSLWLPILLHALIDLVSGSIGRAAIAASEAITESG
jgi:membrane protease YdiL (CAAX protease family)